MKALLMGKAKGPVTLLLSLWIGCIALWALPENTLAFHVATFFTMLGGLVLGVLWCIKDFALDQP